MSIERISEEQERQLISAVRDAISLTNQGVDPNAALAKSAAACNYGPDFVNRMVEMYNTSRTLAHLKTAQGPERASDFRIADAEKVLSSMFSVSSRGEDISGGSLGKAANFMKFDLSDNSEPLFEKAAAYVHDGSAKFQKVLNCVRDLEQDIVNLRTKKADFEIRRDAALSRAVTYFRGQGHTKFAEVDVRMQSMFGAAGKLAMDVVWENVKGLRGEKRAEATTRPALADMGSEPYCHLNEFVERSLGMAKVARRLEKKSAELVKLKAALKNRVVKAADVAAMATSGILGRAMEGTPALSSEPAGDQALMSALRRATDPGHENALRAIHTESMLQDLMSSDPVISQYDPSDVIDSYNELARLSPIASTQPVVLRGYLRRLLESSPDVSGRVLEGHEVGQLADIEKTLRGDHASVQDVLKALGGK